MNNYRCIQCGFLNWATADQCKRCRLPNTANNQSQQFSPQPPMQNTMVAATPHTAVQTQYVQPQNYQTPIYQNQQNYQNQQYQTPPQFHGQIQQTYSPYNNAPPINYYAESENTYFRNNAQVERAKKKVKVGQVAGGIWTVLLGIGTGAFFILSLAFSSQTSANPVQQVETVSKVLVGYLLVMTLLVGGLTVGIRKNSIVCAFFLTIISLGGLINSIATHKIGSILFGLLMTVIFALTISGISTLKKHGQVD
jgi:hypothetical protein